MRSRFLLLLKISLFILLLIVTSGSIILFDAYNRSGSKNQGKVKSATESSQKLIDYDRENEKTSKYEPDITLGDLMEKPYGDGGAVLESDPDYQLAEGGWIPSWDYIAGVNSFKNNPDQFKMLSPVWYNPAEDGSLISRKNSNSQEIITLARQEDVEIIPTIATFDSNLIKSILDNQEHYQNHIDSIVALVVENDYDGIDLDYESIEIDEKEEYLSMVKDLSNQLHKHDKKLSVTVLAKWSDLDIYSSFKETREVQDWYQIGESADQVRIMAYDYTTTSSSQPGPIGPYDWQINILNYAVGKVPREKIWLGVHLYGYEWSENGSRISTVYTGVIENVYPIEGVEDRFLDTYMEGFAQYPCYSDDQCTLYYMTPEGIEARRNLAKSYEIAGITYWRIGREGELLK